MIYSDIFWQWRMRASYGLISLAIKTLPKGWRKKDAVIYLIKIDHIEIEDHWS